ncbi:unnamed protein product, partial [Trichogramma brassicae]
MSEGNPRAPEGGVRGETTTSSTTATGNSSSSSGAGSSSSSSSSSSSASSGNSNNTTATTSRGVVGGVGGVGSATTAATSSSASTKSGGVASSSSSGSIGHIGASSSSHAGCGCLLATAARSSLNAVTAAAAATPSSSSSGSGSVMPTDPNITISITPTTGGQFDLVVDKRESIESLKKIISKKLKVAKERICLLHREREDVVRLLPKISTCSPTIFSKIRSHSVWPSWEHTCSTCDCSTPIDCSTSALRLYSAHVHCRYLLLSLPRRFSHYQDFVCFAREMYTERRYICTNALLLHIDNARARNIIAELMSSSRSEYCSRRYCRCAPSSRAPAIGSICAKAILRSSWTLLAAASRSKPQNEYNKKKGVSLVIRPSAAQRTEHQRGLFRHRLAAHTHFANRRNNYARTTRGKVRRRAAIYVAHCTARIPKSWDLHLIRRAATSRKADTHAECECRGIRRIRSHSVWPSWEHTCSTCDCSTPIDCSTSALRLYSAHVHCRYLLLSLPRRFSHYQDFVCFAREMYTERRYICTNALLLHIDNARARNIIAELMSSSRSEYCSRRYCRCAPSSRAPAIGSICAKAILRSSWTLLAAASRSKPQNEYNKKKGVSLVIRPSAAQRTEHQRGLFRHRLAAHTHFANRRNNYARTTRGKVRRRAAIYVAHCTARIQTPAKIHVLMCASRLLTTHTCSTAERVSCSRTIYEYPSKGKKARRTRVNRCSLNVFLSSFENCTQRRLRRQEKEQQQQHCGDSRVSLLRGGGSRGSRRAQSNLPFLRHVCPLYNAFQNICRTRVEVKKKSKNKSGEHRMTAPLTTSQSQSQSGVGGGGGAGIPRLMYYMYRTRICNSGAALRQNVTKIIKWKRSIGALRAARTRTSKRTSIHSVCTAG